MGYFELNIDSMVGPNHNYAGLASGNLASIGNAQRTSNPAHAAHQGLAKMRLLHHLGLKQAIAPPQLRPNLNLLRDLGFTGTTASILRKAQKEAPGLLAAAYSASSMWTANAATVSASVDTLDNRMHFTAANLVSHLHRAQEASASSSLLRNIFSNEDYFCHHNPLPATLLTRDEGAANHLRLCESHDKSGVNLFVFGKVAHGPRFYPQSTIYLGRQTLEASEAISRSHLLNPENVLFIYQNPKAIDAGAFHNDVVAVANESVLLIHEEAWFDQKKILQKLQRMLTFPLILIEIKANEVPLELAVKSYLFNSQLVTLPTCKGQQKMALIAPSECEEISLIHDLIKNILSDSKNPISEVHFLDLKQSMQNGGGPACLRLRVPLSDSEIDVMHSGVLVNDELLERLNVLVDTYYRSELKPADLDDPALVEECYAAYHAINEVLALELDAHLTSQ